MATIKAIEARSVHLIQSGQVIVDLCSVAKELVENSLDAGATSIEVRFKNNGLDLIEVQDNGGGIAPENYEKVALKHYTSKLSAFDDLTSLETFGFRGEALSSLCALADFSIITAQAHQAPKATRLEFEVSGKLKRTQIVAGQKGTTASVEGIFKRLPVRRRELEKNIKREYGKVLNLLHAYACISTGIRFSVRNTVGKAKNVVVFTTNGNQTTRENIANVYGAKTLQALIPLELTLDLESSVSGAHRGAQKDPTSIQVRGHISRPVFGEGRQTPDRQMLFVNARPCALPQIAKAFNEVYKSFNVSQSPFIFADFQMDTNAYDVNVSPDKRTILLHDAGAMIESLKLSLTELFESADQTVPQSQVQSVKASISKQGYLGSSEKPAVSRVTSLRPSEDDGSDSRDFTSDVEDRRSQSISRQTSLKRVVSSQSDRASSVEGFSSPVAARVHLSSSPVVTRNVSGLTKETSVEDSIDDEDEREESGVFVSSQDEQISNTPQGESIQTSSASQERDSEQMIPAMKHAPLNGSPNIIQNAFDRMRPRRQPAEMATITIGNRTVTSLIGSGVPRKRPSDNYDSTGRSLQRKRRVHTPSRQNIFGRNLQAFAAAGSQLADDVDEESDVDGENAHADDDEEVISSPASRRSSGETSDDVGTGADLPDADATGGNVMDASDDDLDEDQKRAVEDAKVQRLIREAEEMSTMSQDHGLKRANKMYKGSTRRDSTVQLVGTVDGSVSRIRDQLTKLRESLKLHKTHCHSTAEEQMESFSRADKAEERLTLTVTKDDFAHMRIVGQFNLGFILAVRPEDHHHTSSIGSQPAVGGARDELFIIDQHASDEKYNFERLQAETMVQNQRLVQPRTLDLTAVEEEIILENRAALEKNGFVVEIDDSGNEPIGRRCKLVSLPLSKEVVFGVRDLEELIVLLSESPAATAKVGVGGDCGGDASGVSSDAFAFVPRPSKVRKMFAMRACRSSIMIGKTLTPKQMEKVVRNMGTIDKPWNCPHGRPTMRHLMSLGQWHEWNEFASRDSVDEEDDDDDDDGDLDDSAAYTTDGLNIWKKFLAGAEADEEMNGD